MAALDSTDLKDTAVVENKYKTAITATPKYDSVASIKLVRNINDTIDYRFSAPTPQFAVFSEVYYPKGWKVFIDGTKADYVKTDYVLRGMYIPAGNHEIEWRFEPESFTVGRMVSIISNILVALLLLATIIFYAMKKKKPDAHVL
jgi:uncharacterized membrane protein YfhO